MRRGRLFVSSTPRFPSKIVRRATPEQYKYRLLNRMVVWCLGAAYAIRSVVRGELSEIFNNAAKCEDLCADALRGRSSNDLFRFEFRHTIRQHCKHVVIELAGV